MATIALNNAQKNSPNCAHTAQAQVVTLSGDGCKECLETGDSWVHLRVCLSCGHVGCCDSSKNKHATGHLRATEYPIVRSFELGETWAYRYEEGVMV